jgi:hypothetical protein
LEKSLEIYDYAVNYFIIVKDKIIKKINNLENFTKNINELNYIDTENLEKTNIKIQFSDNKYDKSLLYTEIKKPNENKLNFKVKNVNKDKNFEIKRKKF